MRICAILAAATLMLSPVFGQEAAMPSDGEIAQILGDRIGRDQANVGIAVGIVEDGAMRFVSQGTVSVKDTTPITEKTQFEAGSITKSFTSLLLAQLALEGAIDLDAPISTYLPEGTKLPSSDSPITPFTLATHTSGLTGMPQAIGERGLRNPYSGVERDVLFAWLADTQLARPVGEAFEYSNSGYALLGVVLEEATGQSYAQLLQRRVLDPLDMRSTYLQLSVPNGAGMAIGHDAAREPIDNWDFATFAPAGAIVTTAEDLTKFIAAASGNTETSLTPAFAKMLELRGEVSAGQGVGMGWIITDMGQGNIIWHNGGTGGYRSFAGYEEASGNGVVVLSNMATVAGIDDIGMHLLNPSLPLREQPKPRTAVEIDPAVLPNYVGNYVLQVGAVLTVTSEDGKLFVQVTGQDRFEVFPEAEHKFFYRIVDAQITFDMVDGKAVALVLHQNGADQRAVRVD